MNASKSLDHVRSKTLDSMARNEVWFKVLVVLCGIAEVAGLVAVFYFMNWSDPVHRLIFAATMLVYITLGLWVWALAVRNRVGEQRILRAIEVLQESKPADEQSI